MEVHKLYRRTVERSGKILKKKLLLKILLLKYIS